MFLLALYHIPALTLYKPLPPSVTLLSLPSFCLSFFLLSTGLYLTISGLWHHHFNDLTMHLFVFWSTSCLRANSGLLLHL